MTLSIAGYFRDIVSLSFLPQMRLYFVSLLVATLYLIYKLKVNQLYDMTAGESSSSIHSKGSGDQHNDEPFAIQHINLCVRSRVLAVTTLSNAVIVYRFRSRETAGEINVNILLLSLVLSLCAILAGKLPWIWIPAFIIIMDDSGVLIFVTHQSILGFFHMCIGIILYTVIDALWEIRKIHAAYNGTSHAMVQWDPRYKAWPF